MDDLIARLEAAKGPDWRLDALLSEHQYPGDRDMHRAAMEGRWKPTASIDAALTLVPEGKQWTVQSDGAPGPMAWVGGFDRYCAAPTPALAICIASLRARGEQ